MRRQILIWSSISLLSAGAWYFLLPILPFTRYWNIRFFFDSWDLTIYFKASDWVVTEKILYRDIFSEYPLLANLIHGIIRGISQHLEFLMPFAAPPRLARFSDLLAFIWIWLSVCWICYIWITFYSRQQRKINLWLWLNPAALYFALYRFDLYPAIASFLALFYIQKDKHEIGSLFLGICLALKGYALFLLPAYFMYLWHNRSFYYAIQMMVIAIAPFALSNLYIWIIAGNEGISKTYLFHLNRGMNGESTYDAIVYLVKFVSEPHAAIVRAYINGPPISKFFHILIVGLTVILKPKSFEDLVNTFLVGLLGFISFSLFYSPQFLLWILPIVCFSKSKTLITGTLFYAWLTYLYFPIMFDQRGWWFDLMIIGITILRFSLAGFALRDLFQARSSSLKVQG